MAHVGSTMAAITLLWLFQAALAASSAPTSMLLSSLPPNAAAQAGLKLEAAETGSSWAPHWIPASSTTAPNSSKQDMQQLQPQHKAPLQSNRPYVIAHRGASGQPSSRVQCPKCPCVLPHADICWTGKCLRCCSKLLLGRSIVQLLQSGCCLCRTLLT
jgi:hypothetical protein